MRNFTSLKSYLFGCMSLLVGGLVKARSTSLNGTVTDGESGKSPPGATLKVPAWMVTNSGGINLYGFKPTKI